MKGIRFIRRLLRQRSGAAAAEMALVAPLLILIMFGSFELGNYFLNEHVLAKAVRDGARYAGRQPFADYIGCTPNAGVVTRIQNLVRTGTLDGSGQQRIPGTFDIDVTVDCKAGYLGIYEGLVVGGNPVGAPVVKIDATVPYTSLFGGVGLSAAGLNLTVSAESGVMGI
jgi:hypothetical protein